MIYVLDEDNSVSRSLVRLMRSFGYSAESFQSSEQFLSATIDPRRSCLVLDTGISDPNGKDIPEQMQALGITMPIIYISTQDNRYLRNLARQHNASGFFLKPVDGQALLDTIRWILGENLSIRDQT